MLRKLSSCHGWVPAEPLHKKLLWPGLKAKDRLDRALCGIAKTGREILETEAWANRLIRCLLNYVPPERVARLVFCEARRRKRRSNYVTRPGW